jgi:hypothetical protein
MKKRYFFVVSVLALVVSLAIPVESIFIAFTVSAALAVVSVVDSELDELLQAANAPMDNTNKSFFIVDFFVC